MKNDNVLNLIAEQMFSLGEGSFTDDKDIEARKVFYGLTNDEASTVNGMLLRKVSWEHSTTIKTEAGSITVSYDDPMRRVQIDGDDFDHSFQMDDVFEDAADYVRFMELDAPARHSRVLKEARLTAELLIEH